MLDSGGFIGLKMEGAQIQNTPLTHPWGLHSGVPAAERSES